MKKRNQSEAVSAPEQTSRVRFEIGRKNFFGQGAVILLALAIVFRVIGCWGQWGDRIFFAMDISLPILSCLLYILCIYFLGRKLFSLSFLPVLAGAVFFSYKALGCGNMIYTVLYVLFCAIVAVVYACTMFGTIRTKWLLPPLFALPFVFFVIRDLPALSDTANPVTFAAGMQEMSVLCMLLGMLFASLGIRRRRPPEIPVIEGEAVEPEPMPEFGEVLTEAETEKPESAPTELEYAPEEPESASTEAEQAEAEQPELPYETQPQEIRNEE